MIFVFAQKLMRWILVFIIALFIGCSTVAKEQINILGEASVRVSPVLTQTHQSLNGLQDGAEIPVSETSSESKEAAPTNAP